MAMALRPRSAGVERAEEAIECWDDDDLDIAGDDFTFRSASMATTATHRDSVSSRFSRRSDAGSNADSTAGEDDRQFHLPSDDERSTVDAVAAAARAGIPIPHNVPSSALMGGTIKRLGGKKIKKILQDDWDDGDLEMPAEGGLKIKQRDSSSFPDALRQVSGTAPSPARSLLAAAPIYPAKNLALKTKAASHNLMLDRYKDQDGDDDDFGDDKATIKVAKSRAPGRIPFHPPPLKNTADEDFEADFHLPSDDQPLSLSVRRDVPKTPVNVQDEMEDWGEGSLGTRFGGTKRERHSTRSSDFSALSPSVGSSITAESEDEGLDGLVIPMGPLHFDDILKRRQQARSPDYESSETQAAKRAEVKEDFLSGLEIGDGDVFDSKKLTLNRNIKLTSTRQKSPTRPKTAVSLTFTNKPTVATAPVSRLPRPLGHERVSSSLEPVSESGGPIAGRRRRSQSRNGGHSSHSSVTSVHTPTTPSSVHALQPSTPRRRDAVPKQAYTAVRSEATTSYSQRLKSQRSMPAIALASNHTLGSMRSFPSPAKSVFPREGSSRPDSGHRPVSMSRPKTPTEKDRSGAESSLSHARKKPLPFLPAGVSTSQSHHITIKTSRHFRRHDSESSSASMEHRAELRPSSRAVSRTMMRSPSPRRRNLRNAADALALEASGKRQITKPSRRRNFGDGCELDGFDDLPTSRDVEQKFIKEPISRGPPKTTTLRNRVSFQNINPGRTHTPMPLTPLTPARPRDDALPRFARETNASRMREHPSQRAVSSGAPLTTLTNQWKAKVSATTGLTAVNAHGTVRTKKSKELRKPHLIKPLGNISTQEKSVKGMNYNPVSFRWEGNEKILAEFDRSSPVTVIAQKSHAYDNGDDQIYREKENTTPRPALITNINSGQNVQVVGGMVFDPQRMCWLKMPVEATRGRRDTVDTMDGFDAMDDEEDVFKDVPDLEDTPKKDDHGTIRGRKSEGASLKDDWLVGEEFDVGPEFVKRQREEEERWRRKCEKWVGDVRRDEGDGWRWSIRRQVNDQEL